MSSTKAADAEEPKGRELIATPHLPGLAAGQQPIIVFQGLDNAQFERALQLFQPRPQTKFSIMTNPDMSRQMASVAGFLESIQYTCRNCNVFTELMVANHMDNAMMTLLGEDERFSIGEWFSDTRGELPPEIERYNPDADQYGNYMPMPEFKGLHVDWLDALTQQELAYPGFIALFYNCIQMQRTMGAELQQNRTRAATFASPLFAQDQGGAPFAGGSYMSEPSRAAPAPRYDAAAGLEFTSAELLQRHN